MPIRFYGTFVDEKGQKVCSWFDLQDENALDEHLKKNNWQAVEIKALKGVGGWLGYYIFIALVGGIIYAPSVFFLKIPLIQKLIFTMLNLALIYTGYCLWKLKPNAVRNVKRYLVVKRACGVIFLLICLISWMSGDKAVISWLGSGLSLLMEAFIWFRYFTVSKRVIATYPSEFLA